MEPTNLNHTIRDKFTFRSSSDGGGRIWKALLSIVMLLIMIVLILGLLWSVEPGTFSVQRNLEQHLAANDNEYVVGSATTAALIQVAETLLNKPGGFLSNDVMPPGLYLDNIPNWEFGVLVQVRDLSRALREAFSRSQSQSIEVQDLIISEPKFNFDNSSWVFPPSESEYQEAIDHLYSYFERIAATQVSDAQFLTYVTFFPKDKNYNRIILDDR